MMDMIKGLLGTSLRVVCIIGMVTTGSTQALGQSAPPANGSPRATAEPVATPSAFAQAPSTAARSPAQPDAPKSTLEERLRRMEEAYRRMEETNKKIQGQYETLLKKYDELNRTVGSARNPDPGRTVTATTRPVSRVAAVEYQEPPSREVLEGMGAEGISGRTAPARAGPLRGGGVESRGAFEAGGGLPPSTTAGGAVAGPSVPSGGALAGPSAPGGIEQPPAGVSRRAERGIGAQGTEGRVFPPETARRGEEKVPRRLAKVEFAEGLELSSADDEFKLTFHNLTQAEYRAFPLGQEGILRSQFFIPRQRWYFTGRVTRNVEFYTVINRGYGSLDILDAFISYRLDERLRFRIGRMKTPYLYEYYSIAEGDLIAPERSIYAGNLAGNRQIGAMALGELYQGRLGYAVGIYNGPRRSFQDFNGAKDAIGYVNARPFLKSDFKVLNYLNFGGSFSVGFQNDPTQPPILTTANDETGQTNNPTVESLSPTFLAFNENVVEQGQRNQWAGHVVWFYKSLMVLSEYGGGVAGYAHTKQGTSTYIPYNGYMAQVSYFITGEELTRRVNVVKPRRDFAFGKGKWAPGAWEFYGRFSALDFSKEIFTAGFADPNLWSNHAWATDVGINWYLNLYTRVFLDWQHSEFGNPVVIGPNRFGPTRDIFWMRFQVFF